MVLIASFYHPLQPLYHLHQFPAKHYKIIADSLSLIPGAGVPVRLRYIIAAVNDCAVIKGAVLGNCNAAGLFHFYDFCTLSFAGFDRAFVSRNIASVVQVRPVR